MMETRDEILEQNQNGMAEAVRYASMYYTNREISNETSEWIAGWMVTSVKRIVHIIEWVCDHV